MIIGIPKERKPNEARVVLTPTGVHEMTKNHIPVLVEAGAGEGSGFTNADFERAGAEIIAEIGVLYEQSDIILKLNSPDQEELTHLKKNHILCGYLHLEIETELADQLLKIGCTAIAFEALKNQGTYPLLAPLSAIAGRAAVQTGSHLLQSDQLRTEQLSTDTKGTGLEHMVVIGAGVAGWNAVETAINAGAQVTVFDNNSVMLAKYEQFGPEVTALFADSKVISKALQSANLAIGCILSKGQKSEIMVTEAMVKSMQPGSVIVDLSIDQGGCFETSRATNLDSPTYQCHGVTHMCIKNLSSIVPVTASQVLSGVLVPYLINMTRIDLAKDNVFRTAMVIHNGASLAA